MTTILVKALDIRVSYHIVVVGQAVVKDSPDAQRQSHRETDPRRPLRTSIRAVESRDGGPRIRPPRHTPETLDEMRQTRMPMSRGSPGKAWPLLAVELERKRQERLHLPDPGPGGAMQEMDRQSSTYGTYYQEVTKDFPPSGAPTQNAIICISESAESRIEHR